MSSIHRRQFARQLATLGLASLTLDTPNLLGQPIAGHRRKMTINLSWGAIGVSANQNQAIDLASRHGFESVDPSGDFLSGLSETDVKDFLADMQKKHLTFGASGLPVDFRQDDARFTEGLSRLPKIASGLQRAGVSRVGTYLSPCHERLTYLQNFKQHARRLREVAQILKDKGLRLGLEYVATSTLRNARKYPFLHTMAETKELIAEIGTGNVGLVLDSWHWWQAGDAVADILSLRGEEVISVDLNDAPTGIPREQQRDNRRELPCATGVIDAAGFLNALNKIGFDGPVRAEPFNKTLNDLENEEACAATASAMKKAFALLTE